MLNVKDPPPLRIVSGTNRGHWAVAVREVAVGETYADQEANRPDAGHNLAVRTCIR